MVQVGAPSKAYGSNYSRGKAQYERSNPQPSSTDQVNAIIKQAPELNAGQVLDIARATGAVQAPSSGTKPQGTTTIQPTPQGNIITYTPNAQTQQQSTTQSQTQVNNQPVQQINPQTNLPYGTLTPSLTIGQRFKDSTKNNFFTGTLNFIGGEIVRPFDRFSSYNVKNTPGYTNVFSGEQGKIISETAPKSLYFVPILGEGLMIGGGTEQVIKAPTLGGKLLGVGETALGLYSGGIRLSNIKLNMNIKNAQTSFLSQEKPFASGNTQINVISKTKVGNKDFFGFSRQLVTDVPSNFGDVKVGVTRGYVIKGNSPLTPIDLATTRVQPIKAGFASVDAGNSFLIKNTLVGSPGKGMLDFTPIKFSKDIGPGTYTSGAVKSVKTGDYIPFKVSGGSKPLADEGAFSFMGGTNPRKVLTDKGFTLRTNINIRGIIKQAPTKSEDLFLGGLGGNTKTTSLNKFTSERTLEIVGSQRATALDIAKTQTKSPFGSIVSAFGGTLAGLQTQTKTSSAFMTVPKTNQNLMVVPQTKETTKTTTLLLTIPKTKTETRTSTFTLSKLDTATITTPGTKTGLITTPRTTGKLITGGFGFVPPTTVPFIPIIGFPRIKMGLDFGFGARKVGAKARRKYTPSYGALILGIKGKAPTGTYKGGLRPITKGFKWSFN